MKLVLTTLALAATAGTSLLAAAPNASAAGVRAQAVPSASPTAQATPSATPSATASATATASAPFVPTGAPSECANPTTLTLGQDTITATGTGQVTVTGTPGSTVRLFAYSRPSTSYTVVREQELPSGGSVSFDVRPPTNTRLYAQQVGCDPSDSVVLGVRTLVTLAAVRNGRRDYTFRGRALPARPGGLVVSLYRVGPDGTVLTAQTRADAATGVYSLRRVFLGSGRFEFVVRTGQDLQNAPGSSNVRPTLVH